MRQRNTARNTAILKNLDACRKLGAEKKGVGSLFRSEALSPGYVFDRRRLPKSFLSVILQRRPRIRLRESGLQVAKTPNPVSSSGGRLSVPG
jgi:hypothetical protein